MITVVVISVTISVGFCAGYVSEIAMWMAGAIVLTAVLLTASTASSPPLASLKCAAKAETLFQQPNYQHSPSYSGAHLPKPNCC